MRKLSREASAVLIADIRRGLVNYNEIKKKELWHLVHVLLRNPAIGLECVSNEKSYSAELRRIINLYFTPETIDPNEFASTVASKLSYDTFLVLNQFLHYHMMALSDAKHLVGSRPGEIEAITKEIRDRAESLADGTLDPKEEKIGISLLLISEIFQFLIGMAASAQDLVHYLDNEDRSDKI